MRKDFYVFRHGETDLNKQRRWQGSGADYDLNATGVAQAELAVNKLKEKKLEIIFSSPLKRALHTAEIVGKAVGAEVRAEDDLRECFYGDAEGEPIADLERKYPDILNNWYNPQYLDIRFPGGEIKAEALNRVLARLEQLRNEPYGTMGVAIHGGTMGALLGHFKVPFAKIPNCAVFHLIYDAAGWRVDGGLF